MMVPRSSVAVGDSLEVAIHELLSAEIAAGTFWAKKENCRVFRKKGYYSRDRESKIVFDVSVEIYRPGALEFSMLFLVECKNLQRRVGVGEIEEFFAKAQQVAGAGVKAVVASGSAFDPGALAFARSKRMGLLRYFDQKNFKWELDRKSSGAGTSGAEAPLVEQALLSEDFRSTSFSAYMQSPTRLTNSLWDFADDLSIGVGLSPAQASRIANRRPASRVPFVEKDVLEARAAGLLAEIGHTRGAVSLDDLCALEADRRGLVVRTRVPQTVRAGLLPMLGRLLFETSEIEIFEQAESNIGRERFTLAHELAHHLLEHGKYLMRESCDEHDFALNRIAAAEGAEVARLEFQANYFAACLLLPKVLFVEDLARVMCRLDLVDRGFGAIYVDKQPCNLKSFEQATSYLMTKYNVSRAAVQVRLESLGLLRDDRAVSRMGAIQSAPHWADSLTFDDRWSSSSEEDLELDSSNSR